MHAIVCHTHGGPEVMRYDELPQPKPGDGELLIRAAAIGVNYVDTMRRSGKHPAAPDTPFTPGIEVCGRVVEAGSQVSRFQVGDRVIGRCVSHGAYAEYVCVESRFAVPCPDSITDQEGAALFVTGHTAYHALITVGHVQSHEWVLITAAAGGVGLCAVQIAKLMGARVIAAAGSDEKGELARSFGADEFVNYSESDWPQQVKQVTAGHGADLILESVGGPIASGCLSCWASGGRMVVFGKASGQPAIVSGDDLLFGNRTVHGLAVGMVIDDEAVMREAADKMAGWLSDDALRLRIGKTYPLSDAAEAHRDLAERKTTGKLILLP